MHYLSTAGLLLTTLCIFSTTQVAIGQIFTTQTKMCETTPSMMNPAGLWHPQEGAHHQPPTCRDVLLASVFLPDGGADWALEVSLQDSGISHTPPNAAAAAAGDDGSGSTVSSPFTYAMARTALIAVAKKNSRITYPLSNTFTVRNAYEGVRLVSTSGQCADYQDVNLGGDGEPTVCCQRSPLLMEFMGLFTNSSDVQCSAVEGGRSRFDVIVSVSFRESSGTETSRENITLTESVWQRAGAALNATITNQFIFGGAIRDFAGFYLCEDLGRPSQEPFFVPTWAFGTGANKIGMSSSSFEQDFNCHADRGSTTRIVDSNPFDQFSAFRGNTISAMISGISGGVRCEFVTTNEHQMLTARCSDYGSASVLLEMPASEVKLIKLFAVTYPLTLSHSWSPPSSTNTNSIIGFSSQLALFFLDINNRNQYYGSVRIAATQCCALPSRCSGDELRFVLDNETLPTATPCENPVPFATTKGGGQLGPADTIRHTIQVSGISVAQLPTAHEWCKTSKYSGSVVCSVEVEQHGVVVQRLKVMGPLLKNIPPPPPPPPSNIPSQDGSSPGEDLCANDPTKDLKQDPISNQCVGLTSAECVMRYMHAVPPKSFYNDELKRCEPVVSCMVHEFYNSDRNLCEDPLSDPMPGEDGDIGGGGGGWWPPSSPGDTPQGSENPPPHGDNQSTSGPTSSMNPGGDINCGPNGQWSSNRSDCVCDDGYSTSVNQDPLNRSGWVYCTSRSSQKPANYASEDANVAFGLTAVLLRLSSAGWLVIVLIVVSIVCVIILNCCFNDGKRRRRKSSKKRLKKELKKTKKKY